VCVVCVRVCVQLRVQRTCACESACPRLIPHAQFLFSMYQVDHPNIVQLHQIFDCPKVFYMVGPHPPAPAPAPDFPYHRVALATRLHPNHRLCSQPPTRRPRSPCSRIPVRFLCAGDGADDGRRAV
jgi:hypothetical protein